MEWWVRLLAFFLSLNLFAGTPDPCPEALAGSAGHTWEQDLQDIRESLFEGFRLQGIPSASRLVESSESGPLRFHKVAARIALAENVLVPGKSRSLTGSTEEHAKLFQTLESGLERGAGEYFEVLRNTRAVRRMGTFVALGCAAGTAVCIARQDWVSASVLLPQVFLSKYFANSLASLAERDLAARTEGQQMKQLRYHASLVESPVAGAWAATGFNRESYAYSFFGDTDADAVVEVNTDFLDVYTWVDKTGTPHTKVLAYSTKGP